MFVAVVADANRRSPVAEALKSNLLGGALSTYHLSAPSAVVLAGRENPRLDDLKARIAHIARIIRDPCAIRMGSRR